MNDMIPLASVLRIDYKEDRVNIETGRLFRRRRF